MKIFLTGGTGFIGSYVAVELLKNGHEVTILARNPGKVPELGKRQGIRIVGGDISDTLTLDKLMKGQDACIHVALNYARRLGPEVLLDDTLPTVFLADAAARSQLNQFIYTSSTAANDSLYMGDRDDAEKSLRLVTATTKQHPATFYGATKAAGENFVIAQSHLSPLRVNVIRPGYVFGNPVVSGGSIQGDMRFRKIVQSAIQNQPIPVIKNDGTQFIWAGDLARLYAAVLHSGQNRRTYFGLSKSFISWHKIAQAAVEMSGSRSRIELEDKGWSDDGLSWDVSDMMRDFGLEFDPWNRIIEHLDYCFSLERAH